MTEDKTKKHDLATEEPFYSHNVEEAVMHIVGGTLHDDPKKRKASFDPFNMYMNGSPVGWDILEPIQPEFFPQVNTRKKRRTDTNVDPALSQIYHTPPSPPPPQPAAAPQIRPPVVARGPPSPTLTPSSWNGESQGNFLPAEVKALDEYMNRYCQQHNLTRQQLCDRVWSNDRKKDTFWDSITAVLPHRTRASVYKHVRRTYHVFDVRGKWTPEEDQKLRGLFEEKGPQWRVIGRAMERMPEDCRDRWRNYVKCGEGRKENKWTPDEVQRLESAVTEIRALNPNGPINWVRVSERMGETRSRIQCRYKWAKIMKQRGTAQ